MKSTKIANYYSKKNLVKKNYLSKKHSSKKYQSKNKHKYKKKVYKLSQYGSSSGWLKPNNTTNEIAILSSSQLIPFLETEIDKNKTDNNTNKAYIFSIGCAPFEDTPDLKQIYGDDINYQDIKKIEPYLIIIDKFNDTLTNKTLEYLNSPSILQVFKPENIVLFNMYLPTNNDDPIYSSLSLFVNQFNDSNGCVIVRNFIRFKDIDYHPDVHQGYDIQANKDEIAAHLIYKILFEEVFLQQPFTPNKLLLRWFGYTDRENNILADLQYCQFMETNNDEILINTTDNDIRLLQYLCDRTRYIGSYRQDIINILPIKNHSLGNKSLISYQNMAHLERIEPIIEKWKPIPLHIDIKSNIQNLIDNELENLIDHYQQINSKRGKPIPVQIKGKIEKLRKPINLYHIVITSNALLSIEAI